MKQVTVFMSEKFIDSIYSFQNTDLFMSKIYLSPVNDWIFHSTDSINSGLKQVTVIMRKWLIISVDGFYSLKNETSCLCEKMIESFTQPIWFI